MDINRLSLWEKIVAGAGLLLAASPLLPWWSVDRLTESGATERISISGFQALSVLDVVVFAAGIAVLALIGAKAVGHHPRLPVSPAAVAGALGALIVILTAYRGGQPPDVLSQPKGDSFGVEGVFQISSQPPQSDLKPEGIDVALALGGLIAFGAWRLLREQGTSVVEQARLLGDRLGARGVPGASVPARAEASPPARRARLRLRLPPSRPPRPR